MVESWTRGNGISMSSPTGGEGQDEGEKVIRPRQFSFSEVASETLSFLLLVGPNGTDAPDISRYGSYRMAKAPMIASVDLNQYLWQIREGEKESLCSGTVIKRGF